MNLCIERLFDLGPHFGFTSARLSARNERLESAGGRIDAAGPRGLGDVEKIGRCPGDRLDLEPRQSGDQPIRVPTPDRHHANAECNHGLVNGARGEWA